jgi:hypothetical protein
MDVVDAIAAVPVTKPGKLSESQPTEPVLLTKVTVAHMPKS